MKTLIKSLALITGLTVASILPSVALAYDLGLKDYQMYNTQIDSTWGECSDTNDTFFEWKIDTPNKGVMSIELLNNNFSKAIEFSSKVIKSSEEITHLENGVIMQRQDGMISAWFYGIPGVVNDIWVVSCY